MTDGDLVHRLLARYWLLLDDRRSEDWLALFHDDAILSVAGVDTPNGPALQAMAASLAHHRPGTHLSSNESVTIEDDRAEATSDVAFLVTREDGTVGIQFTARCEDLLVRCDDDWRFAKRAITFTQGVHAPAL